MPRGICPLCQLEKDLVDSHFLPAASYKPLHGSGLKVNEPMVLTSKRIFQSSRQITAHAFCADCEDRFDRNGEGWVLNKLANLSTFPLRDMITAAPPLIDEGDFKAYSCDSVPGFRLDCIVHLAVGLFWKSAARTWNMIDGPAPRIQLGPYEESVRQFVLGTGAFPKNVCLVAYVDLSSPPLIAVTPPRQYRNDAFHLFVFYMNGLQFSLCVGKQAPLKFGEGCIATGPSHPIFLIPDAGKNMFAVLKELVRQSRPSKGILRTLEQWKALRGRT
jgi:hypothetical protein